MVIGNGDIAAALKQIDREDVLFFASGVSNSRCTDVQAFEREASLMRSQDKTRHIVYISTLSIYYGESMYIDHKKYMENMVRAFDSYTIIRIGNITWGDNPNTLINYLRHNRDAVAHQVYRYLVDLPEFLHWVGMAKVGEKQEMNITGRMVWVPDLAASLRAEQTNGKIYAHGPKY